jgi:hypothetical protein
MWKSGGVKPEPVSPLPKLPAPRSRWRGPLRLLIMMAVLFTAVVFVFPLVFKPRVEPPADTPFGSPFSVAVRISNLNVTPLQDVEYSCEITKLTLATGAEVTDARILMRGTLRRFQGRRAIAVPCETAYVVNAPIKAAEYRLTFSYRAYPWPKYRTGVYRFSAQIDRAGRVTGWKLI